MDQLFKQTVDQDGQRSEADVVQRQINTVVQSLGWDTKHAIQHQLISLSI